MSLLLQTTQYFPIFPETHGTLIGMPVWDVKVCLQLGVIEEDYADVARILSDQKLTFLFRIVWLSGIDPGPEHVMVVMDVSDYDTGVPDDALGIRHEVETQPGLIKDS